MKNKCNRPVAITVVCAVILAAAFLGGAMGLDVLSLPFTLIASGLRLLSLSGSVGNVLAIALLVALGLLPLLLKGKGKWRTEDLLLPLASVLTWYALYYLINPGLRPWILGGSTGDAVLSGTVYSVLLSWGILRLVKCYHTGSEESAYRALEIFLTLCAASHLLSVAMEFSAFLTQLHVTRETNTMMGLNLTPTYLFLGLRLGVAALQHLLNGWILWLGGKLVSRLREDPYSEAAAAASARATFWCRRALVIVTLSDMGLNLLQVFFARQLHSLAAQFSFPLSSLAVIFAMMVLSDLLVQGKELKDDNRLFI